ncbi:MAG: hypothetical protein JXR40_05790 [Pontiellaceae bacterium]|nr:hypothetical protein [Pontiellaceae bacterium]
MKKVTLAVLLFVYVAALGDTRVWEYAEGGETIEAEYKALSGNIVELNRTDDGKPIKIPLEELSAEDRRYVAINNAPRLKVELRGSRDTEEYIPENWEANFGWEIETAPINITEATFGASITQLDTDQAYDYNLYVEICVLTKQCYDPSNFHLISHARSEPFRLNAENHFRYMFADKKKHTLFNYRVHVNRRREDREYGEMLAEYLVLVRNEYDEVVGYTASSAWLYHYLVRLKKMPVGAWINDECIRIHPTTPEWGK